MVEQNEGKGSIGIGLLISGGVNLGALVISCLMIFRGVVFLLIGFGLLQFLWLLPLYVVYKSKGEGDTGKGILLGAGLTLLLSAACWASLKPGKF